MKNNVGIFIPTLCRLMSDILQIKYKILNFSFVNFLLPSDVSLDKEAS